MLLKYFKITKAKGLFFTILLAAVTLVACRDDGTIPPDTGTDSEKPPIEDVMYCSYYKYSNQTEQPITLQFGDKTPSSSPSLSFVIYPGDKYEVWYRELRLYPGPFCAFYGLPHDMVPEQPNATRTAAEDVFVTVSNGEKQFTHKRMEGYLMEIESYRFISTSGINKRYFEYAFSDNDFKSAQSITEAPAINQSSRTQSEALYTSYFGFINACITPITVEYHSADYGKIPFTKSEKFTIYPNDKYEVAFVGNDDFPKPFLALDVEDYVTVSNGKKTFTQKFGKGGSWYLFKLDSYELINSTVHEKNYIYTFTDDNFETAKPIE